MTLYPDNIREFVTQESVPLGDSGYDVEVEIVRKSNLQTIDRDGGEVASIGLRQFSSLPPMKPDDLFVVFDLGTVLEIDEVRFADAKSGSPLTVEGPDGVNYEGPVRVPAVLTEAAQISLLLAARERPFGTLIVEIQRDGRLAGATFLSDRDG